MSTMEQSEVRASHDYGLEWNIGKTMGAINAHESHGGRWPIRVGEDAFGDHHLRAYYAACRVHKTSKPTIWQQSRVAERLLYDNDFDLRQTRLHLEEIISRHGDEGWMSVWAAYNGGDEEYAEQIRAWVRFLNTQFK